jgi:hypothetical protein
MMIMKINDDRILYYLKEVNKMFMFFKQYLTE